jgi:putative spermidine/putrescine transport system substrate-binding protein
MKRGHYRLGALACAVVLLFAAAACGGDDDDSGGASDTTTAKELQKIGAGEGAVSILAWPGYAEDGSTSKDYDWVTPFEQRTGCQASVKTFGTSDEAYQLFKTGQYDVVSASGDATLRIIANGDAAPLNTDLLTNYKDLTPFLVGQRWNTVDGVVYGEPHGWGANLLMFNDDVVKPAPDSWGAVFDDASRYKGKVTAYDSPIYIADAALYLSKTQPDLKITDPYALDQEQFDAAVNLLKEQKASIGEYWSDYLKEQEAFIKGSLVVGTTWQVITNGVQADTTAPKVTAIIPKEGSTAWSDSWMVQSKSKHPNCSYEWLNWITNADIQAQVAEYFGEAPANLKACDLTSDKNHCATYHADDQAFYDELHYWTTPTKNCLDGRTDVDCVDYGGWTNAWDEVKGS